LSPVRVGISACLLGQEVRFDGGHKRDSFLADELGKHVEWVPVCPEVEVGMGTPREPLRLVRDGQRTRMVTIETGVDYTDRMNEWARRRVAALGREDLDGYVLKKNSPSCGMLDVRIFNRNGDVSRDGQGLFATVLLESLPLLPVEEEGHLDDPRLRENFIARVFAYRRLKDHVRDGWSIGSAAAFHIYDQLQFQRRELMVPNRV
jgi:uncharacterized protein YbbK (DUF523 family)